MRRIQKWILLLLVVLSCGKKETPRYQLCNDLLGCTGTILDPYCTFGFKWGDGNPFSNAGAGKPGPSIGPVVITYTFADAGRIFSTHSQDNLTSRSFSDLPSCSKDTIRHALARWEAVAGISFVESGPGSNLTFIMGDISQSGVSFPPFPQPPCSDLAGQVAFQHDSNRSCKLLFELALHEIGHALGLGHVQSPNVMNPKIQFVELQGGDIAGVQSIYGRK
ncbi:MAG: matrixin family metalloprotease [Cyclobacteriaceae bacterium]|nr:matrixin family metalloprotease [Cyclobacteriaceae bacterium]